MSDADVGMENVDFVDNELNDDIAAFEQMEHTMNLTLDTDSNLQLAEADNLNDTFQRRDSLQFGDEVFQNNQFDFNAY